MYDQMQKQNKKYKNEKMKNAKKINWQKLLSTLTKQFMKLYFLFEQLTVVLCNLIRLTQLKDFTQK